MPVVKGMSRAEIQAEVLRSLKETVDVLYNIAGPDEPFELSARVLGERINLSQAVADDRVQELTGLGIVQRVTESGRYVDGKYKIGRWSTWTLLVTREEAHLRLDAWNETLLQGGVVSVATQKTQETRKRRKEKMAAVATAAAPVPSAALSIELTVDPVLDMSAIGGPPTIGLEPVTEPVVAPTSNGVAMAKRDVEETRAIAGPDAPKPLGSLAPMRRDESRALVEAARQYANRDSKIADHVAALKRTAAEMGIEIDEAVFTAGIRLPHDDRLEAVALALPYIESLERAIERTTASVEELRTKVKRYDELDREVRSLRNQNERLIAARPY